ncbi:MAG: hypothetical protein JW841_14990 [Deltaproteobacteria bacterium]|nr:hypothetical protein [Deltaproteobacteria bacterium]
MNSAITHRGICLLSIMFAIGIGINGCKSKGKAKPKAAPTTPLSKPPDWVTHLKINANELCGIGVAGAGFDEYSPHPKRLSRERAIRNLAGVLGTNVLEAIVDKTTDYSQHIEIARGLHIDDSTVDLIDQLSNTEYWLDRDAVGPFAQQNFTYAYTCVDTNKIALKLNLDPNKLKKRNKARPPVSPEKTPKWITKTGKQPGGRLCAVGFSMPTFFADNTFEAVVEDIRSQLAEVVETLVSQYTEEITSNRSQTIKMMTVATTQAISKGVVVTDFWYDRDAIGPQKQQRSTYGWGCVYPVDIMKQSIAAIEEKMPEKTVAKVRERAAHAFEDLDAEIAKREGQK